MKNLNLIQMESLRGGFCILEGPGNSSGNSNVTCTGLCLASPLAFDLSGGNYGGPLVLC